MDDFELILQKAVEVGPGRKAAPVTASVLSELKLEDFLADARGETDPNKLTVKEIRSSHHLLAQTLAKGIKEIDASRITGYTQSRISVLKADPQFQELLTHYRDMEESARSEAMIGVHEKLAAISNDSLEIIQERLDTNPDAFETKDLIRVAELGLDRTGHGKTATLQVKHGMDDATLARIKAATQSEAPRSTPVLARDHQHLLSGPGIVDAEFCEVVEQAVSQGLSGEGADVREQAGEGPEAALRELLQPGPVDHVPGNPSE